MRTTPAAIALAAVAVLAAGCGGASDRLTTQNSGPLAVISTVPASSSPVSTNVVQLPPPTTSPTVTAGTVTVAAGQPGAATASPVWVSAPPGPASPTPQASADPARLTEADSGQTIHLHVGEQVNVELPGGSSGGYHQPVASSDVMTRTSATGGYPTDQPARARFVASRAGTADLTSYDDFSCLHSNPRCLPPQHAWVVHVVVQ